MSDVSLEVKQHVYQEMIDVTVQENMTCTHTPNWPHEVQNTLYGSRLVGQVKHGSGSMIDC